MSSGTSLSEMYCILKENDTILLHCGRYCVHNFIVLLQGHPKDFFNAKLMLTLQKSTIFGRNAEKSYNNFYLCLFIEIFIEQNTIQLRFIEFDLTDFPI